MEKEDVCRIRERVYSSGEKFCDDDCCYICRAGDWELGETSLSAIS